MSWRRCLIRANHRTPDVVLFDPHIRIITVVKQHKRKYHTRQDFRLSGTAPTKVLRCALAYTHRWITWEFAFLFINLDLRMKSQIAEILPPALPSSSPNGVESPFYRQLAIMYLFYARIFVKTNSIQFGSYSLTWLV